MGNILVDIEGLARVIKPLILRLKRKALTSLGPGCALVGGGEGEEASEGEKVEKKMDVGEKPNWGVSREVVWRGEIKGSAVGEEL